MAEISKNSSGLSGEYFVAAELYRRGWSVGITIGNAKAIDMLAEKDGTVTQIQVKTIYRTKSVGWPIDKQQIKRGIFYIFVNLMADKMESPEYFICTSEEVIKHHRQNKTRGIVNRSSIKKDKCLGAWDKLGQPLTPNAIKC